MLNSILDFKVIAINQPINSKDNTILKGIFKDVQMMTDTKEMMTSINSPTILLIDIDQDLLLLKKVCQSIANNANIIPIACSQNDSTSLMIECIQMGACDFILKPFHEATMKTVFLNIYRQQQPRVHTKKSTVWSTFQHRLEKFYHKGWLSIAHHAHQTSLSMDILSVERKHYLDQLIYQWDFSPLELDERELIYCGFSILQQTFNQFSVDLKSLRMTDNALYDFVFDVYHLYHHTNPYHNFRHAIDVMQSTWYFLYSMGLLHKKPYSRTSLSSFRRSFQNDFKHLLRPVDILALLMASLGHDVGHPGVNNGFMVNTASPLAFMYNDTSVLESYHCMTFLNLLRKHYFRSMIDIKSHAEYKTLRKIITTSILSTDMGCHQDYLEAIQSLSERLKQDPIHTLANEKERLIVCSAIIKCADISNCARPFDRAREWAMVLSEEFYLQGDLELELGITPFPMHSRGQLDLVDFQLSFINNVALELFCVVEQLLPALGFCTKHIQDNFHHWTHSSS